MNCQKPDPIRGWKLWLLAASTALLVGCNPDGSTTNNAQSSSHAVSVSGDATPVPAGAIKTELRQDEPGKWTLVRDGQPYRINGAGGEGSLQLLADCGGNSTRLWGVDGNTRRRLDEAHRSGLSVAVGVWLEHQQKGFDYSDGQKTQEQFEKVLAAVKPLHDHPAVLVWGLGNEMEGYEAGDNPDLWRHVDALAKAIKEFDPKHLTMTVIAEITPAKVAAIHQYCPHLDIIGINSYGGCATLSERYRAAGGEKPFIVTEFGPVGTWEVPRNNIDAIVEPDSATKAQMYQQSYEALQADPGLCLGAYAFLWGHKQEGTATWFGMLLPDGKKTNAVDTMRQFWTAGKQSFNHSPRVVGLKWEGGNEVQPGGTALAQLEVEDRENDSLSAEWTLMKEADRYVTGGDFQNTPPSFLESITSSDLQHCSIKLPQTPGLYRLYVVVHDQTGAATANLPIRVAEPVVAAGPPVDLPFAVYREAEIPQTFAASGWMGATDSMHLALDSNEQPFAGTTCIKCEFRSGVGWGGVAWQHPAGDWGEQPGGLNFEGAQRLRFRARGAAGGETVKFGFGILGRDKPYFDTAKQEREVVLTQEWQAVEFDLSGVNLSRIKTPFYWVVAANGQPLTFFLDEIVIE